MNIDKELRRIKKKMWKCPKCKTLILPKRTKRGMFCPKCGELQ